jgi:hypothetical protein
VLQKSIHLRAIRLWLSFFIAGLIFSGVTAFPLEGELHWFLLVLRTGPLRDTAEYTHLLPWITRGCSGISMTNKQYPFLAYGTDWLAFAHLVIAVAFLGPYRDPVRNNSIITFGLFACGELFHLRSSPAPYAAFRLRGESLIAVSGSSAPFPLTLQVAYPRSGNQEKARIFPHTPAV